MMDGGLEVGGEIAYRRSEFRGSGTGQNGGQAFNFTFPRLVKSDDIKLARP